MIIVVEQQLYKHPHTLTHTHNISTLIKRSYFSLASGVHSSCTSLSSDGQLDDDGEKASSLVGVQGRLQLVLFALDDCTASAYDLFVGLLAVVRSDVGVVTPTQ